MPGYDKTFYKGENVGYLETPLTYPGELVMGFGATVTKVLDEIVKALGNYEYFYDVDGVFHFQKIKNYLYTGNTPLNYGQFSVAAIDNTKPATVGFDDKLQQLYLPVFQADAFLNEFSDTTLVTQVGFNPSYDNIKNDFIVWGTRDSNEENPKTCRYHLAIDKRPVEEFDANGESTALCNKSIYAVYQPKVQKESQDNIGIDADPEASDEDDYDDSVQSEGKIIRYQLSPYYANASELGYEVRRVCKPLKEYFKEFPQYWYNWREELYRIALLNYGNSTDVEMATNGAIKNIGEQYFEELRAEWRNIFDPESNTLNKGPNSFESRWTDHFGRSNNTNPWHGYCVEVATDPSKLRYWLDLLDTDATIGQFSVDRIGRRSVVKENNKVNEVFPSEINDVVFIDRSNTDWKYMEQMNGDGIQGRIKYYNKIGQAFCIVPRSQISLFQKVNSFGTCFDDIRDLLYNHLIYQSSVNLTSIPLFYMDVNKIVRLNFPDKGITGDYVINQINYSLGAAATMTLQLQEAMVIN